MADESTPSVATLPVLAVVPCADRTGNPDDT
jgi:hypothetical protein